jgi:hypothetical protein
MGPSRDGLERRGHGEDGGARHHQPPVELGEAQVVADRQTEPDVADVARDELVPRAEEGRLPDRALPRQIDVIEMDLPVARDELAVGSEQRRRVVDALTHRLAERPPEEPQPMGVGRVGEGRGDRSAERLRARAHVTL